MVRGGEEITAKSNPWHLPKLGSPHGESRGHILRVCMHLKEAHELNRCHWSWQSMENGQAERRNAIDPQGS